MANVQLPGFIPNSKGGMTVECERKRVLTNNTTAIFKGDLVDNTTAGDLIVLADLNQDMYSVQWGGASYVSGSERLERRHLPAATLYTSSGVDPVNASYIYTICGLPSQEFKASIDEAIVLADIGLNYKVVLGAGSTASGLSGHELDATSPASTATFPVRVLDFIKGDPKSDPDSADAHVRCMVNAGNREPALEPGGSLGT
jgi:hypothetical protein